MSKKKTKSKNQRLSDIVMPKLNWFLDVTVRRNVPSKQQLIELFTIKYLYLLLAIVVLKDMWYTGYGSYGIDFNFWKEIVASVVFYGVTLLYLRFPIEGSFLPIVVHFVYVLYYIPLNSAFALNNASWMFFFLSNLYFFLLLIAVHWLSDISRTRLQLLRPNRLIVRHKLYHNRNVAIFCFIACCVFIVHKLSYNGLSLSISMEGEAVYSNRATYQEYLDSISGSLFSYLLAIVRNVISYVVPFYILTALLRHKKLPLLVGLLCTLAIYSVASEKGKLLMPIVAVVIFLCYKLKLLKYIDRVFNLGMVVLLTACLTEHMVLSTDRIYMLIVRREMYIPAWLNVLYYDFFSQNDKVLWTQNVILLQNIFEPVYSQAPLDLINNAYFRGAIPSPNTGLFAEAYMHFGSIGVILYPLLVGLLLVLSETAYSGYGKAVQVVTAAQLTLSLTNVPITRTDFVLSYVLFTGILWILPRVNIPLFVNKVRNLIKRRI